MKNKNKSAVFWIIFMLTMMYSLFMLSSTVRAELLDKWDYPNAYRPKPILFLHGFGKGGPQTWTGEEEKPNPDDIDRILNPYFDKYFTETDKGILKNTDFPYLEVISFIDEAHIGNTRQELVDRNSSIDTYKIGDYYVSTGERSIGFIDNVDR